MRKFVRPVALFVALLFTVTVNAASKLDDAKPTYDSTSLIVQTAYGKVRGAADKNVFVWKGIPYAAAPVGNLRFKAPQKPANWNGVKDALQFGPMAPQVESSFTGTGPQNEDCLYLNVWSPGADAKKRPVMVWIHGGGFVVGAGSSDIYNGANLANKGDVVIVTINYRLGVLGFLHFNETQSGNGEFENNLGIRDQIAALQWVKENIAAFGGDPAQVTIFGESAGGTSVETLLACKDARGLFARAIAESGPASILWQKETATDLTNRFLAYAGISPDSLHLLKTLPVDSLEAAQEELMDYMIKKTPNKVFSPTIDGKLLTTDIFQCLSPMQSGNVPVMIGTNKDESTVFASRSLKMAPNNAKDLEKEFFYVLKPEEQKRITAAYKHYPRKRGVLDLLTDAVFRIPAIRLAECQSMHSPVYMYRFEYSSFLLNLSGKRSFHGLEIPFVFGNTDGKLGRILNLISTKKNTATLTEAMQTAWLNFARYGNPNGNGQEIWKPFDTNQRATMVFDKTNRLALDPDAEQRIAWEGVRYY